MESGDKYLRLFVEEATELAEGMQRGLQRFEEDPAGELPALYRSAHSIKGMAASLGLDGIEGLSHALEDLFDTMGEADASADSGPPALLGQAVDRLSDAVAAIASGGEPPSLDEITAKLRTLAGELVHAPGPAPVLGEEDEEGDSEESGDILDVEPLGSSGCAEEPSGSLIEIEAVLDPDVELPLARAAVLRKRLEALGGVRECALDEGGHRLRCLLATPRPAPEVESALRGQVGVVDVSVRLAPTEAGRPSHAPGGRETVKVAARLLDQLLEEATELLIQSSRLDRSKSLEADGRFTLEALKGTASRILDRLLEARLLPFASITPGLERAIRDLGRRLSKEVRLVVIGEEVRLDRAILDHLVDPITHLLRNAVDHGIEPPEVRRELGKPGEGTIEIRLERSSDTVVLTLEDDGGGIDTDELRRRALEEGAIDEETCSALSDADSLLLATMPGLSTAAEVSEISGRGVGLDAVRDRVEALGGSVHLESELGRGTRIVLRMPPTVAVLPVFLVRSAGGIWAVPVRKVEETVAIGSGVLRRVNGRCVLPWKGDVAEAFCLDAALEGRLGAPEERGVALVYEQRGEPRAVLVDEVIGCREVVIKPLPGPLEAMGELTGAAVLGDGSVAPVLDLENVGPPMAAMARKTA